MFITLFSGKNQSIADTEWQDRQPRPLAEAACLARLAAEAEDLPLLKFRRLGEDWFHRTMQEFLKADGAILGVGTVRRTDFERYLDWLRSFQ
jgi:hypothetical protein